MTLEMFDDDDVMVWRMSECERMEEEKRRLLAAKLAHEHGKNKTFPIVNNK